MGMAAVEAVILVAAEVVISAVAAALILAVVAALISAAVRPVLCHQEAPRADRFKETQGFPTERQSIIMCM